MVQSMLAHPYKQRRRLVRLIYNIFKDKLLANHMKLETTNVWKRLPRTGL